MDWMKSLTVNWKTNLAGIVTFLLSVPAFVSALSAWAAHQPVDWRSVIVSVALTAGGVGLISAKDSTTHSTIAQVQASTQQEKAVEAVAKADTPVKI
jgi:NADH:ubiquinone oxidoreductase subunit 4 (subunit M)